MGGLLWMPAVVAAFMLVRVGPAGVVNGLRLVLTDPAYWEVIVPLAIVPALATWVWANVTTPSLFAQWSTFAAVGVVTGAVVSMFRGNRALDVLNATYLLPVIVNALLAAGAVGLAVLASRARAGGHAPP